MDAREVGRLLVDRHAETVEFDLSRSLLNVAECPVVDDWTLRSALVRLAQPEPERVGRLLEVLRRLEAPLQHVTRALGQEASTCDRSLDAALVGESPITPYVDARIADLARLGLAGLDLDELAGGYDEGVGQLGERPLLSPTERQALPLLVEAVRFERLAQTLTRWAGIKPDRSLGPPPVDEVDAVAIETWSRLDELGVPVESQAGPDRRPRSRG